MNGEIRVSRTHIHTHTHAIVTSRHAYHKCRTFKMRTFPNLFGRFSRDDEIIYTKCIPHSRTTGTRTSHIHHEHFSNLPFFVATGNAWKFSPPNVEGHTHGAAAGSQSAIETCEIDFSLCTFGEPAFLFLFI